MPHIESANLKIGMEIHVELATRRKMFAPSANLAHREYYEAAPNSLIDPVVLGLPGALPVMNKQAIEFSMLVGMALGCSIAETTRWDRKGYFYPDLPKGYQISQYDLPLCFDGSIDVPDPDDPAGELLCKVGIIRAHLEEDAGKLLHEWPGGKPIDYSIVDLNRAGVPLLEIVTAPDLHSAQEAVGLARFLRDVCRFLGASEANLERGQMRFEPNINAELHLDDGRLVTTPIVEIKNLNSFKALSGAIEYEFAHLGERYLKDGKTFGPGSKSTRGWDDVRGVTVAQREKEDAHEYRYFPDPDLPPLSITSEWQQDIRAQLPELPLERLRRYINEYALGIKEAQALVEDRAVSDFFEDCVGCTKSDSALDREALGKLIANLILQHGFRLAHERRVVVNELGISPPQLAGIAQLRQKGTIGASSGAKLFAHLCASNEDALDAAAALKLLQVSDDDQIESWCDSVIADSAYAQAVSDVQAGVEAATGRLIGAVMQRSHGQADARLVRTVLLKKLR